MIRTSRLLLRRLAPTDAPAEQRLAGAVCYGVLRDDWLREHAPVAM